MGSEKRIASGVFWTTLVNIVNGVYGFISVPILLACYGKSDYGLIALAMSVNVYLRLMDLGFNSTNVRFFSNWLAKNDTGKVRQLFQTSMAFYGTLGIINSLTLCIISVYADRIFNLAPEQIVIVKNLFYILAISAFISWFTSCFEQLVKAHEQVGWTQKILLLPKLSQFVILALTVMFKLRIEVYYALTAFSMFMVIPFLVNRIRNLCPYISFRPLVFKKVFMEVLPYTLNIFSFGIFQFSILNLRPVFLGIQCTPSEMSDYRILEGIIRIVLMLGGAFMSVLLPTASRIVAVNDTEGQHRMIYQGTRFVSIAICFCCFGMISVAPELITVYVGREYLYLIGWLDLWLLTTLCTHNQAISVIILAGADIRAITYCTIVSSMIGLLICWFTIPAYQVGGTVIGYAVYCIIQLGFYYFYYWPHVLHIDSLRVFFKSFLPYMGIGLLVATSLRLVHFDISPWLVGMSKGFAFLFAYALLIVWSLSKEDIHFLKNLVAGRRHVHVTVNH